MSAKTYSVLAAAFFTVLAVLQLVRAVLRTHIFVAGHFVVPIAASWIVFALLAVLAIIGFRAASKG